MDNKEPEELVWKSDDEYLWFEDSSGKIVTPKFKRENIDWLDEGTEELISTYGLLAVEAAPPNEKDFTMYGLYSLEKRKWEFKPKSWYDWEIRHNDLLTIVISAYNAPKMDSYIATVNLWVSKSRNPNEKVVGSEKTRTRKFNNFYDAYFWNAKIIRDLEYKLVEKYLGMIDIPKYYYDDRIKNKSEIKGKRLNQSIRDYSNWHKQPFNRDNPEAITWIFEDGELEYRGYKYDKEYEYTHSDEWEKAGMRFKKGDFIIVSYDSAKIIYVVADIPGEPQTNDWENLYTLIKTYNENNHIYTIACQFNENFLEEFNDEISKESPQWFLHEAFSGNTNLTDKQIEDIYKGELIQNDGKWCIVKRESKK